MRIFAARLRSGRILRMKTYNIAIDGPSGAGKSTAARALAARLNIAYLDTGALYRAVGLKAMRCGWKENNDDVAEKLRHTDIRVAYDNGRQIVYLDGEDVSVAIRNDEVSSWGSRFSALPSVRAALLGLQRRIADEYSSVLDGRDIGTCVLPSAKYKFFLTASVDKRALRRYNELRSRGADAEYEKVRADIEARDYRDTHREVAPLRKADDAIEINSDDLDAEEVVQKMLSYISER